MPRSLYLVLLLLSLIWGGSFFFIKLLLHDFGPWTIACLRSAFGLAAITIIMLVLRKPFAFGQIRWGAMTVMALINTAIPWGIIAWSETRLTSSMTSVLNATTPLQTLILGILFFRAVSNRQQWIGIGIALIGLIILLGINPSTIVSVNPIGFMGMLSASFFYALGSWLSKNMMQGLTMYQITFGTLLSATLGSGIAALSVEQIQFAQLALPSNLALLVGLGVFGSGIAYILFYYLIQKGSPQFATMVTYLVPVSAIFWGYALLHEEIHWYLLVGLIFILGGVFFANKKQSVNIARKTT